MPSLFAIAEHWLHREFLFPENKGFWIGLGEPYCMACGWLAPCDEDATTIKARWRSAGAWLDKAHLVDRSAHGLDGPQNLVVLCKHCHATMPPFTDGIAALSWVRTREHYEKRLQREAIATFMRALTRLQFAA